MFPASPFVAFVDIYSHFFTQLLRITGISAMQLRHFVRISNFLGRAFKQNLPDLTKSLSTSPLQNILSAPKFDTRT